MSDDTSPDDLVLDIQTPLGFQVHVTRLYWELIVTVKHPIMSGREQDVIETLESPDEIRLSRSDDNVYLFYKQKHARRWVCAVTKRLNGNGFLITAYPTDAIKEGARIWPK